MQQINETFSSSSSSSESGSSVSRTSTPISDISSISPFCEVPLTHWVHVPSYSATPELLHQIFILHNVDGIVGVIFDNNTTFTQEARSEFFSKHPAKEWAAHIFDYKSEHPTDYFVNLESDSVILRPSPDCDKIYTDPVHAKQLLAISAASLRSVYSYSVNSGHSTLHIVERPTFTFTPVSRTPTLTSETQQYSHNIDILPTPILNKLLPIVVKGNIPTPPEWRTLWSAWDLVTLQMIPQEMLHQKPIDLRHKCLFYIGHIPTFLDMLLSKAIGGSPSEPAYFWKIFERGIDPHVDDPDHCHNHSEVPEKDEDWPTIGTIIQFRDRVRQRLRKLYTEITEGKRQLNRNIARTLVMTMEHEGFHIETLLYMLIQRAGTGTLPPPGFTTPPWEILVRQWNAIPPPTTPSVVLGPATVTLGHDDSEADDKLPNLMHDAHGREYGWDNESPARQYDVGTFRAEWRPVTNGEFESFWRGKGMNSVGLPKSWVEINGEIRIRTLYGLVSMDIAEHWPVLTSYDDLSVYAKSKGGRLPTEPELRLFLDTYEVGHEGGANVGFRNWHPVPATMGLEEFGGKGSNGGVWEWTSTCFDTHPGLAPTNLFTGYSTDFFDTKHQVVLGASYATIPRLAGRRTVRNFYQHNYPYPWATARVVYDV